MKTFFYFIPLFLINTAIFASLDSNLINEEENYIDRDILIDDQYLKIHAENNLKVQMDEELNIFEKNTKENKKLENATNDEITDEVNLTKSGIQRSPAIIEDKMNFNSDDNESNLNFLKTKQRRVRSR